jgi:hypothetical protein
VRSPTTAGTDSVGWRHHVTVSAFAQEQDMTSAIRKVISVLTLATTLLVVVRQFKEALEAFKKKEESKPKEAKEA